MSDKINEFFTWKEAACRDGSPVPEGLRGNVLRQAENMLKIRQFFGAPVHVNSWYRTPEYNAQVGGEDNSYHMKGLATDFTVAGFSPGEVAEALEGLIRCGAISEGGIGRYRTFVHYDCRGKRVRWTGH